MKKKEIIKQQEAYRQDIENKNDYLELENTELKIENDKLFTELEKMKNSLAIILEDDNVPF